MKDSSSFGRKLAPISYCIGPYPFANGKLVVDELKSNHDVEGLQMVFINSVNPSEENSKWIIALNEKHILGKDKKRYLSVNIADENITFNSPHEAFVFWKEYEKELVLKKEDDTLGVS